MLRTMLAGRRVKALYQPTDDQPTDERSDPFIQSLGRDLKNVLKGTAIGVCAV